MATSAELAAATAAQVASARAALSAFLQAAYPTLSLTAGPLADLVLGPAADALAGTEAVAAKRVASLDPAAALAAGGYDPATLAVALAGRGVVRREAAAAAGTAVLVFSADETVTVPAAYRLTTADGTVYRPAAATTVRATTATQLLAGDSRLVVLPVGGFAATLPVVAVAVGAAANRPVGTSLTPAAVLTNQTAAYVGVALAGGADAESDAALLARLPAATAPRDATSVLGVTSLVTAASPTVAAVAVQGYGHPGLRRARSVVGLQSPGKADARVRSAAAPARTVVRVTATYQGLAGPYGSWRFDVGAADVPGWFAAEKVLQAGGAVTGAGYAPTAVVRGFDTSADASPPDVRTAADAAFSAYTTARVTFTDPDTSVSGLTINVSTRTYDAVFRTVTGMTAAQAAVNAAAVRAVGGDCLVRAATPVLAAVTAAAVRPSGVTLTAGTVAAAVARAINETGISPTLNGAAVAAAAAAYLPTGTGVVLSGWSGTAYPETGTAAVVGDQGLAVATDWTVGVGLDAVAYYADPEAVTASVT